MEWVCVWISARQNVGLFWRDKFTDQWGHLNKRCKSHFELEELWGGYSFGTELVGEGGVPKEEMEDVVSCLRGIDGPFEVAWALDMRSRMVWMD